MIDLYCWPTPNGHKVTMFLEEAGLACQIHHVDIGAAPAYGSEPLSGCPTVTEEGKRLLFGQTAASLGKRPQ